MRSVVVIGLVVLAGLSGCSKASNIEKSAYEQADRFQMAIRKVVPDEERAERLAGLQAIVQQETKTYYRNFHWAEEDARLANADYDSTRDAFERIADGLARDRKSATETIIRVSMRLRSEMTPEEWALLKEEVR